MAETHRSDAGPSSYTYQTMVSAPLVPASKHARTSDGQVQKGGPNCVSSAKETNEPADDSRSERRGRRIGMQTESGSEQNPRSSSVPTTAAPLVEDLKGSPSQNDSPVRHLLCSMGQ